MGHPLRTIATACLLFIAGCSEALLGPDAENTPEKNFDLLWSEFDRYYASFDTRGIDWDSIYRAYRPLVNSSTGETELFEIMTRMLSSLHDGHISLMTPDTSFSAERKSQSRFDLALVSERYLSGEHRPHGSSVVHGLIDGEIGYLRIADFVLYPGWGEDLERAMKALRGAKGIIIDMRGNPGGYIAHVEEVAGRFADTRRPFVSSRSRNGRGRTDFTPPVVSYIEPRGDTRFPGRTVVLTDRRSASAAEWFTLAMRQLPTSTIIGDTTAGNLSTFLTRELPNGWIYTIPTFRVLAIDGISYEGTGVPPALFVPWSAEDVEAGRDPMIERAVGMLK